jgi:hypothetical protein
MERSFRQYLLAGTMLAGGAAFGGATPAAANVCPAVGSDADCGIIINITSVSGGVGTFTVTKGPSFGIPYDGVEDTLVGVVNNSGGTVTSIHLTSKTDIFGFDGDGAGSPFFNPGFKEGSQSYAGTISTNGSFNLGGRSTAFRELLAD